jgi:hypothetical protein
MGIFTGIKNVFQSGVEGYGVGRTALNASRAATGAKAGKGLGWIANKAGYALGRTGPMMALGVAAATAAVVGGMAWIASRSRSKRKEEMRHEEQLADMQAREMPMPVEMGPAPDRAPGEWQNRIAAARGQAPALDQPLNPKQSVVPESSVQNLGR